MSKNDVKSANAYQTNKLTVNAPRKEKSDVSANVKRGNDLRIKGGAKKRG